MYEEISDDECKCEFCCAVSFIYFNDKLVPLNLEEYLMYDRDVDRFFYDHLMINSSK